MRFLFKLLLKLLFGFYRYGISPIIHLLAGPGQGCRFQPTCSEYAREALERFGPRKGSALAARRIARCNPFGGSGYDPVPESCNSVPPVISGTGRKEK